MRKNQKGFTLIELMIVVAIIGILASIATLSHQTHIARSQASEAFALMVGGKATIMDSLQAGSCTSANTSENTITGKYGDVVITGIANTNSSNDTGCIMTYTFKGTENGVSPKIAKKTIEASLLNNGSITKYGSGGTIEESYLPKSLAPPISD